MTVKELMQSIRNAIASREIPAADDAMTAALHAFLQQLAGGATADAQAIAAEILELSDAIERSASN